MTDFKGHGGKSLVHALAAHGTTRVFSVAGESYLPALDAMLDFPDIQLITCRQESGATFMAEAHGALSGQPGIAFVTRGPGACNASIGVHSAMQASTPMILFIGLIGTSERDKEAFQEFDVPQMFGSLSKWAAVIDQPDRIGEYVARAYHIATSGRPGPVVLGLPEEILTPNLDYRSPPIIPSSEIAPASSYIQKVIDTLSGAARPLILVGGSLWSDQACDDIETFSSASHIPVVTSFRRQDVFNHNHGDYIGELGTGPNPELVERVQNADVVLVVNARINEITTQTYALFQQDEQTIIHVHPDAAEFGKACLPDVTVQSHVAPFCAALAAHAYGLDGRGWAAWRDEGRVEYLAWSDPSKNLMARNGADVTAIFQHLQNVLPDDAIVTTDAGNFSGWAQRYLKYGRPGRLLAPVSGAMGYAIPSAVAASMQHPDRIVVGMCGDGGCLMTSQEFATAMHHNKQTGCKPIIMVFNNDVYGTIRMHQNRDFLGREHHEKQGGTALTNPDFAALAQSYGALGLRVNHEDEFPAIWDEAIASDLPVLIEVKMDPAQSTTRS
jgi:acetolactate synthase-1/2/3 large subunit